MPAYSYPTPNSVLKEQLRLQEHPEGGYYAETDRRKEQIPSPYAKGEPRSLATQIYYLLDSKSVKGKLHLNLSTTYHLLHNGRAKYTLLRQSPTAGEKPVIKQVVMGEDVEKGELRQLLVEGGWWKASELPEEDLSNGEEDKTGCLISEVVVPGFDWHDHAFLTRKGLLNLFNGDEEDEWYQKLLSYVKSDEE
ncbi:Cff1p [Sporobolomyces koalae]|uniref:Cff1p n=1 Tax=Sporobolomyces koalae TaxID=500713 RepID=UPI00317AED66